MKKMAPKTKSQEKNKMSEIDEQILKYFDIKKRLGKGAYGVVWKATDKKTNHIIAVKKIFDAFRNETDAQRTFREIMFLRAFRSHPNVIQLFSIHKATNNLDIYLAFEFMESDLHNVIKRGTILKDIHKRYVMYQLFNAVKYIHSGNVIHRDLKPSNVLIDSKCRCKIADFGLARSVSNRPAGNSTTTVDPTEPILTDYVATRWYRAPEILIASKRYTKGIDMWSLGCILGEMIRGKPLFPGSSTVNQIEKIVASLPEVTEKDMNAIGSGFGSVLLNQQIDYNENPALEDLLKGSTDDAKILVKSLLVLDPNNRLTAKEALSQKYIEKFRHSISEAELNTDVLPPFRDDVQLTVPEYRSKLYEIMQQTTEKSKQEKFHCSAKQTNHKKKELINGTKVDKINSSNVIQKRPSPLKSDDRNKREYQCTKYTDKKHQLPQNINSNQISTTIKQNINSSSSYHNTGNHNVNNISSNKNILSSSSSSISNKTESLNQHQNQNHKFNEIIDESLNSELHNSNETKLQPIGCKIKNCKILSTPTIATHTENKLTYQQFKGADLIDNHTINKSGTNKNVRCKRHSIDCTPNPLSSLSNNLIQQFHSSSEFLKSNSLNTNQNSITSNCLKFQNKNYKSMEEQLISPPIHDTSSFNSNTNLLVKKKNSIPIKNRNNDLLTDKELVERFKIKKIDIISTLSENKVDESNYYEKRIQNLEDKISRHKSDIKELLYSNSFKLQNIQKTDTNNSNKLNKFNSQSASAIAKDSLLRNLQAKINNKHGDSFHTNGKLKQYTTQSHGNFNSLYPDNNGQQLMVKTTNQKGFNLSSTKALIDLRKSQIIS